MTKIASFSNAKSPYCATFTFSSHLVKIAPISHLHEILRECSDATVRKLGIANSLQDVLQAKEQLPFLQGQSQFH
mgnify:CR=1 FL=1